MKGLFLKVFVMLFLIIVKTADLGDQSSCGVSTTLTLTKEQLSNGGYHEELEAFLAAHSKDLEGGNVVIETIITPIHSETAAGITTTQTDPITSSAASPKSVTAATPTSVAATASTSGCEPTSSEGCFWVKLIGKSSADIAIANNTCTSHGSVLAVIRDQDAYEKIVDMGHEALKKTDDSSWNAVGLWLGMTYDPTNKKMSPEGSVATPWRKNFPEKGTAKTQVLVFIKIEESNANQGLGNRPPSEKYGGVVCWKPVAA